MREIPGPKGLLGLGVGPRFQYRGCEYLTDLTSHYGRIVNFPLPGIRGILVSDKNLVKQVLLQTERQFYKGKIYDILKAVVGEGLVTNQGPSWRQQRKLLNPLFQKHALVDLDPVLDRAGEELKKKIAASIERGIPLATTAAMMEVTFSVLVQAFFSGQLETTQYREMSAAFKEIQGWIGRRFTSLVRPPLNFPTPANLRLRRAKALLTKVIFDLQKKRSIERKNSQDLLDILLGADSRRSANGQMSQQTIDEMVTFLIAGHDTTALTLAYTCVLLAENQPVRDWLGEELSGRIQTVETPPISLPSESLEGAGHPISRLHQCLLESMRIYPAVWAINRNNKERLIYEEYEFEPDTTFFVSQYAVHRDQEYWPEPLVFKPQRFAQGEPDDFSFFPFSGGPRTCIGNHLAMLEALGVLKRILVEYTPVKLERSFKVLPQLTSIPDPEILIRWKKI